LAESLPNIGGFQRVLPVTAARPQRLFTAFRFLPNPYIKIY
jgi:hypothetical protein